MGIGCEISLVTVVKYSNIYFRGFKTRVHGKTIAAQKIYSTGFYEALCIKTTFNAVIFSLDSRDPYNFINRWLDIKY